MSLLDELLEQRKKLIDEIAAMVDKRQGERTEFEQRIDPAPTDEERGAFASAEEAFDADFRARKADVDALDKRIDEQQVVERRREEAARASRGRVSVTGEPLTYRRDLEGKVSYFGDLAVATAPGVAARMTNPAGSLERLERHAKEMSVELPKREAAREARAQKAVDEAEREFTRSFPGMSPRGLSASPFERRTNPNRTDGQGGYFVPPLWLVDEYIPGLRAGRVAAGLCRNLDLPEGTDSINIPKLSTLTKVDVQTADNAPVASQDFTDTSVSASVKTLAGQEDVAIQLIEQSPGQIIDRVVMEDLLADYNKRLDLQVLSGTGASGQIVGIYPAANWTGTNGVTYTNATPTQTDMFQVAGAMASQIATNRFSVENVHYLWHPRRWFWFASGLDANKRPLVEAAGYGPFNVAGLSDDAVPAEGLVGSFPQLPRANVYIDANVTTADTTGGGSGQDIAVAAKWDDLWLFEGALRTRVLPEILSGTLEIRFQVYNYLAFLVRYGQSIAIATGSGFAAPTGSISTITF